jgi:hypothetical protein
MESTRPRTKDLEGISCNAHLNSYCKHWQALRFNKNLIIEYLGHPAEILRHWVIFILNKQDSLKKH